MNKIINMSNEGISNEIREAYCNKYKELQLKGEVKEKKISIKRSNRKEELKNKFKPLDRTIKRIEKLVTKESELYGITKQEYIEETFRDEEALKEFIFKCMPRKTCKKLIEIFLQSVFENSYTEDGKHSQDFVFTQYQYKGTLSETNQEGRKTRQEFLSVLTYIGFIEHVDMGTSRNKDKRYGVEEKTGKSYLKLYNIYRVTRIGAIAFAKLKKVLKGLHKKIIKIKESFITYYRSFKSKFIEINNSSTVADVKSVLSRCYKKIDFINPWTKEIKVKKDGTRYYEKRKGCVFFYKGEKYSLIKNGREGHKRQTLITKKGFSYSITEFFCTVLQKPNYITNF